MKNIGRFFVAWRTIVLRDREVVDGLVDPRHASPSAELSAELLTWPGRYYWSDEPSGRRLVLIRSVEGRSAERWGVHVVLFVATLATTLFSGAVFAGALPLSEIMTAPATWWRSLPAGWVYSAPLLAILLAHEMGHYVVARRYAIDATPPFFLPWPFWPFIIGTLGAFIRLRSPVLDRRQLMDVGAAGPIAGFVVALPVLVIGLLLSTPIGVQGGSAQLLMRIGPESWQVGHSVLTYVVSEMVYPEASSIVIHPAAFAGWIGILLTALNLIPLSQLDGGHILYAVAPRTRRTLAMAVWLLMIAMGYFWSGWIIWAFLVLFLSRGRLQHPPVVDDYRPLPRARRVIALTCAVIFVLCFTPAPFVL